MNRPVSFLFVLGLSLSMSGAIVAQEATELHDAGGRRVETQVDGERVAYLYDEQGALVKIWYPDGRVVSPQFRFVGVTTATFAGDGSKAAMSAACAIEYPGARMAYADEYSNTPQPSAGFKSAWVNFRPTVVSDPYYLDVAGNAGVRGAVGYANSINCDNWSVTAGATGMALESSGRVRPTTCTSTLAVACAAPGE